MIRNRPIDSKGAPILIEYTREKEINAIIFFIKNTKYCGKTKLFKLLYFLDFIHFKQTAKSVTGLIYNAWPWGPAPADLFNELEAPRDDLKKYLFIPKTKPGEFFQIMIKKGIKFEAKYFSKRELRIMAEVAEIFKEAFAEDMVNVTHLPNDPWDRTINLKGERAEIDYMLSIDGTKESLSKERAHDLINEREETKSLFYQ
jgi:uncharacterized phage-associated protein